MSALLAVPDVKAAFVEWARSLPELAAWCPPGHIVHQLRSVTGQPANWLVVVAAGGFSDPYLPVGQARFDLHFYGVSGFEAMRGWRIFKAAAEPRSGRQHGFSMLGCRVTDVMVGMPFEMVEQPNWEKRVASAIVRFIEESA